MITLYIYLSGLVLWITVEALWGSETDDVGIVFRGFTWPLSLTGALIVGVLTTLAAFSAKLRQGRRDKATERYVRWEEVKAGEVYQRQREDPKRYMPPRYR